MSATKILPHEKPEWNGYTLDELRYMRAYTAARLEINRDRMQRNLVNLKNAVGLEIRHTREDSRNSELS